MSTDHGGLRMTEGRRHGRGRAHRWGAAALAGVVLTAAVVLLRLDEVLGAMRLPGAPRATATGLASPLVLVDLDRHLAGVEAWAAWDASRVSGWGSRATLGAYVAVDCVVLAPALGGLLLLLNAAARGPALRARRGQLPRWAGARLVPVPFAAVTYVLFDVLENLALLVTRLLVSEGWLGAVGVLSILKWLALVAAVVPLVVAGLAAVRRWARERLGGGARTPSLGRD